MIKKDDKVTIKDVSKFTDTNIPERVRQGAGKVFVVCRVYDTDLNSPITYDLLSDYEIVCGVSEVFVEKLK